MHFRHNSTPLNFFVCFCLIALPQRLQHTGAVPAGIPNLRNSFEISMALTPPVILPLIITPAALRAGQFQRDVFGEGLLPLVSAAGVVALEVAGGVLHGVFGISVNYFTSITLSSKAANASFKNPIACP